MAWFDVFRHSQQMLTVQGTRKRAYPRPQTKGRQSPAGLSPWSCLQDVLRQAAAAKPSRRLVFYQSGNTSTPREVEYSDLYEQARRTSQTVRSLSGFEEGCPVLLHLDDHWDAVLWFWAVLLAGGLPVLSSPLSNVAEHRQRHLESLSALLQSPICITRTKALGSFDGSHTMRLHAVEELLRSAPQIHSPAPYPRRRKRSGPSSEKDDLAMLMLTSGSTGNAKAVRLTHHQVLAAAQGKASVRALPRDKPFLNWIGLDHVASLVEIHIQAMCLGVDQVHVYAADIVSAPTTFLDLLTRHKVSRSFAPNFFLAKLASTAASEDPAPGSPTWDLSNLAVLASGGEANDVDTCRAAASLLATHGAPKNVITPGFGMTETCAGAIFNLNCPLDDVENKRTFASLGKCMKGIDMRVTRSTGDGRVSLAAPNEAGNLEVRGEVVFEGYYRNGEATIDAFTPDRWFKTGDQAIIDSDGNLNLIGRVKEVMNINGVKVSPAEVQTSLEQALGTSVSRVVCFPSRVANAPTEQITVAYVPNEWPMAVEHMVEINDKAVKACILCSGSRPFVFPVGDESLLPNSALGKISKAKMRTLFEKGMFAQFIDIHNDTVDQWRAQNLVLPSDEAEMLLIQDFAQVLGSKIDAIGADTPVYDMGFTSMDLIRLKRQIDTRMQIDVPVITLMNNPTARSLAVALRELAPGADQPKAAYDPVVTFRPGGSKTPLWLIHPGVGEVLVFVGLAQHMADDDRPIYALRARGFEPGQPRFQDINETVETYEAAIRKRQPEGPYAIAGYSYGTMLAFEVAKRLNSAEDKAKVQFLGSFNLPPHIKPRMRQLNWNMCLLHLSYFLGLATEEYADQIEDEFRDIPRDEAMARVLDIADKGRMAELQLNEAGIGNWADLAFGLQGMAVDYEPSGVVDAMDVFHAIPLKVAAKSREDWVENHLSRWADFCRTAPQFHKVGGAHYTMLGPDHVADFAATLKGALRARGL